MGAPLALQSIHQSLKDKGYTMMEYEEELRLVRKEDHLFQEPAQINNQQNKPSDPKQQDPAQ